MDHNFAADAVQINGAFERVALGNMLFEHPAQRVKSNATKLRRMQEAWNPEGFGVPLLSADGADDYKVIDGRHRCTAALALFGPHTEVLCEVFHGLTQAQEHDLFLARNNQTVISSNDRYPNELGAGRDTAVAVNDVLSKHGLKVGPVGAPDTVRSPGTLVKIYERDGADILDATVSALLHSFGVSSIVPAFVDGLAQIFDLYNGDVRNLGPMNRPFMGVALSQIKGANPWASAVNSVKAAQAAKGGSAVGHAARFMVDAYNLHAKDIGEPVLPSWDRALVVQERAMAAVKAKAESERRAAAKVARAAPTVPSDRAPADIDMSDPFDADAGE